MIFAHKFYKLIENIPMEYHKKVQYKDKLHNYQYIDIQLVDQPNEIVSLNQVLITKIGNFLRNFFVPVGETQSEVLRICLRDCL